MKSIQISDLYVGYRALDIVKNINLTIPKSKITAIIGPNGCGKSTLLKAMGDVLAYRGSITIDGKEIRSYKRKSLARILAFLPQKPEASNGLTVEQLVSYGRHPYASTFGTLSKEDYKKIHWAMEVTGLSELKSKKTDELSGGQKQRVWIALCLAQDTEIIYLDEPTTYLDIAHQLEILEILKNLNERYQKTIVMVLHDLNQASHNADHIIAMKNGHIIKVGSSHEVINKVTLKELFSIEANIVLDQMTCKPMCMNYKLLGA